MFDDWEEIQLLFQLTDQELSGQSGLFGANEVSQGLMSFYLFFATLNQTCGKRQFRNPNRQHRNITTLMRYKRLFEKPDAFIEMVESIVPFMNGGLFECLDKPDPSRTGRQGGEAIMYEDGFSDRGDNTLKVPDFLFFGQEQTIDLSGVYGDKKRRQEKVRGIIPILNNYKFTILLSSKLYPVIHA